MKGLYDNPKMKRTPCTLWGAASTDTHEPFRGVRVQGWRLDAMPDAHAARLELAGLIAGGYSIPGRLEGFNIQKLAVLFGGGGDDWAEHALLRLTVGERQWLTVPVSWLGKPLGFDLVVPNGMMLYAQVELYAREGVAMPAMVTVVLEGEELKP